MTDFPLIATSDPGTVIVPIPEKPQPRLPTFAEWTVPVELVLRCPCSSVFRDTIRQRIGRGDQPLPDAKVYLRHGRYFCEVYFPGANRPGVFMALDLWAGAHL